MHADTFALFLVFYLAIGGMIGIGNAGMRRHQKEGALTLKGLELLGWLAGVGYAIAGLLLINGVGLLACVFLLISSACGGHIGRIFYDVGDTTMRRICLAVMVFGPAFYHLVLT